MRDDIDISIWADKMKKAFKQKSTLLSSQLEEQISMTHKSTMKKHANMRDVRNFADQMGVRGGVKDIEKTFAKIVARIKKSYKD